LPVLPQRCPFRACCAYLYPALAGMWSGS
jgi:hypothetical protein